MNKKAAVARHFWWYFRIPLLLVMMMFLWVLQTRISKTGVDTASLEYDVVVNRIYQNLAYVSPNTGRIYPNIIDQNKFNEEFLNTSFTEKNFAIKLSLTNNPTIFFNKEFYEFAEPIKGISKYQEIFQTNPIQVLTKDNKLTQEIIKISIIYQQR